MADTGPPQQYRDTRTARAEKWAQEIKDLRAQIKGLEDYEVAHQMFRAMIEDAFKSIPSSDSREIARAELMEFAAKRQGAAQQAIRVKLRAAQNLENTGVE